MNFTAQFPNRSIRQQVRSFAYQTHERPNAYTGWADRQVRFSIVIPRRPCNVQMSPGHVVHEFAQKISRRDRARLAPADVFNIGNFAFDLLAVFGRERELPEFFARALARGNYGVYPFLVVAENCDVDIT